ncbi:MAG: mannose-1-phosphate guanylyltransferase/mannose-6-phosphate isomerase [Hyphomicrobiales bacterium]
MSGDTQHKIVPVVLCGGGGERLWPLSRTSLAKQLIRLHENQSLFELTLDRLAASLGEDIVPIVLTGEGDRFVVAEQVRTRLGHPGRIVLEPMRRDTAAAVALAVAVAAKDDPRALLLVCPADHLIEDAEGFGRVVAEAAPVAAAGRVVTFGIEPTEPATGYGYIRAGAPITGTAALDVDRFVEKPNLERAEAMLAEGGHFWNSGIFLFRADVMRDALATHYSEGLSAVEKAARAPIADLEFWRIDEAAFGAAPKTSIDYAVIEKIDNVAVVPARFDWNDVGSWVALATTFKGDGNGNASRGPVVMVETTDTVVYTDPRMVTATLGVDGLVVAATPDAVLVAPKSRSQDIRKVVAELRRAKRKEADEHPEVFRPWGSYQGLVAGDRYQVKKIRVKPGGQLSLQRHNHRAEHWIVVRGTAQVTVGEAVKMVTENESVYIPIGANHRLENPGKIDLELIEVQTGSYLGEDDIVRLSDVYNRTPAE